MFGAESLMPPVGLNPRETAKTAGGARGTAGREVNVDVVSCASTLSFRDNSIWVCMSAVDGTVVFSGFHG